MTSNKDNRSKVISLMAHREERTQDAFSRAVQDHGPTLIRFIRARLANHHDREDLAQEIYLRLAKQSNLDEKLSRGDAPTRSYLFSIATNLIRDMGRRAAVRCFNDHIDLETVSALDPQPSPEEAVIAKQALGELKTRILKLKPRIRRAFVLSRFYDLSYREIADQMGVSVSMVEKYISRALTDLRR